MEEILKLEKNDIVRTPRGYLAKVNWASESEVGCTYIGKGFSGLEGMTFPLKDLFVVKRGSVNFFSQMFKKMSDEDLRRQIDQEREKRSTLPTEKERTIRKKDTTTSLIKELSKEDAALLVEFLNKKKGG